MDDEPQQSEASSQNVRAVSRALAVLSSFAGKRLQSLADVANTTGLDKGTARRLLLTMMKSGFIIQEKLTQQYRLGRAIRDLAADVEDDLDLRAIAAPVLTQLATDLHLTAFISIYVDGDAICVDRIHDMKGIEVHWWSVGSSLPYNCGGAPKLLLAYQSADEIARVMTRRAVAMTPKSLTDPVKLLTRLTAIRHQGYEFAVDDVAVGLTALAVPVAGAGGRIHGCISIAGLTPQMASRGRPVHLPRLHEAARLIEVALDRRS